MRNRLADPQPGILAKYTTSCSRCPEPIVANVSRVVHHRGTYIHCSCANGADDE